jgi:outer membrane protein assembly factor BamB
LNVGSPIVSSPSLHNGILVAATYDSWIKDISFIGKNFVLGIDSNYGTQIWSYEIPGDVFSSPCLVSDGMMVVVGSTNKIIYAIERKSGNTLWMFETGGEVWSSPSYNGNEIFIESDDGFLYCLDIDGKLF